VNATLKSVLEAAGLTAANAVPVVGQIIGIAYPLIVKFLQRTNPTLIAPPVEEMKAVLFATLDQGDAEWAGWVASHPRPPVAPAGGSD
jgi:hypothetical protein